MKKKNRSSQPLDEPSMPPAPSRQQRLQKVLADAGIGSRRECEGHIAAGRVTVDGAVVTRCGTCVDARQQVVAFDGNRIRVQSKAYWWLYKPPGVLSTNSDPQSRPTVLDFIPPIDARVYCVGRLDMQSTGLMLLTNDGDLANHLTHPRYGVPKTYEVLVAGKVSGETLAKLKEGLWLSDGKVSAARVRRLASRGQSTRLQVVLREGRNREIRRMFARLGHKVIKLERSAMGPVKIRRLKPGQSRPATEAEIQMLRNAARQDGDHPKDLGAGRRSSGSSKPTRAKVPTRDGDQTRPPGRPDRPRRRPAKASRR